MSSNSEPENLPTSEPNKLPTSQPLQPAPFDLPRIVRQLEDLVNLALECEKKELLPNISFVEVHKKLLKIRQQADLFQENFRQHLARLNLRPEDVRLKPEEIANLAPKDRHPTLTVVL